MSKPKRPSTTVRTLPFKLPDGREGAATDLNDVLRHIVRDMREANDWSEAETARRLGMTQQSLHDFLEEPRDGKQPGVSVATLSKMCAAGSHNSPVLFFQRHPLFATDAPNAAVQALAQRLTVKQAETLVEIVDVLLGRQSLDAWLAQSVSLLGVTAVPPKKSPGNRKSG